MKYFISIFIIQYSLLLYTPISAQVLCIVCSHQNERILPNGNNLIMNGGFENGCNNGESFCPMSQDYECNLSNWICSGGGPSTYAHITTNLLLEEGNKAAYFGNAFSQVCPFALDTSCLGQADCEVTGIPLGYPFSDVDYGGTNGVSLEQNVEGLIPGEIYELEFWAGGEDFPKMDLADGVFAVDVGFGKIYLRDPATPPEDGIGIRYVVVFKPSNTSMTLKFTNWGHIHFEATELVLDDVRLIKSSGIKNPCTTSADEVDIDELVDVVPNPFHSSAKLELKSYKYQKGLLLIYNSMGSLVKSMSVDNQTITIERNGMPNGVYFFKLVFRNQNIKTGKFIIE